MALCRNEAFRRLVNHPGATCDQITAQFIEATGNVGHDIVLNPPPGSDRVWFPSKTGPEVSNFHSVYTDGNFVFDLWYRDTPIPLEEWQAEVNRLNGINMFPD
jgi:hypothetical protein